MKAIKRIRILAAHWQPVFRTGLVHLLRQKPDLEVVAEAGEPSELLTLVGQLNPDIVLLNEALLDAGGPNFLARIQGLSENTRILVLEAIITTNWGSFRHHFDPKSMVSMDSSVNDLVQRIRGAMKRKPEAIGLELDSGSLAGLGPQETSGTSIAPKTFGLTWRELQIISAVVLGLSNQNIGKQFDISEDTVKHHISNIFDKMGVDNRLELALFAVHHRLVMAKAGQAAGKSETGREAAAG